MGLAPIRVVVFRVAATARAIAEAQRNDVLAEERRSARNAPLPANPPDHTRRIVVSIKHGFAPLAAVIGPAFGDNEPIVVTASVLCNGFLGCYSAGPLLGGAAPLKTAVGASSPWVRIPPCPPIFMELKNMLAKDQSAFVRKNIEKAGAGGRNRTGTPLGTGF